MLEQKQIRTIQEAKGWGRILGNRNKMKLLVELSKGALSKSKIVELLGVTFGTVNGYVSELINLGIAKEETTHKDNKTIVHIVKLKCSGAFLLFKELEDEGGWRSES